MTPAELRHIIENRLAITQREAARLVGRDERTIRRWLAGHRRISDSDAAALLLIADRKVSRRAYANALREVQS